MCLSVCLCLSIYLRGGLLRSLPTWFGDCAIVDCDGTDANVTFTFTDPRIPCALWASTCSSAPRSSSRQHSEGKVKPGSRQASMRMEFREREKNQLCHYRFRIIDFVFHDDTITLETNDYY